MESTSKINEIISEVIFLLKTGEENEWVRFFSVKKEELLNDEMKKQACIDILDCYNCGKGSFLDLVLHKNGKPLMEENNRLYDLKRELYAVS